MTFPTFPYSVANFLDQIYPKWSGGQPLDIQRYDENSVMGSGANLTAELAVPKWKARMEFADLTVDEMLLLETRVRKLNGQLNQFMYYDPRRKYPKYDPTGSILGGNTVQVNSVGSDQTSLAFKGLPANYQLNIGDKGQVAYGSTNNYFFEISEAATASGAGVIATPIQVWPYVPISVITNAVIIMAKPSCKMGIENFDVGASSSKFSTGVALDLLEHI